MNGCGKVEDCELLERDEEDIDVEISCELVLENRRINDNINLSNTFNERGKVKTMVKAGATMNSEHEEVKIAGCPSNVKKSG